MTSTDKKPIADDLLELSAEAAAISRDAVLRIAVLAERASQIRNETEQINTELRQFLDQFTLESGLAARSRPNSNRSDDIVHDMDKMHADIAQMAIDGSQAACVADSVTSLESILHLAATHFSGTAILTKVLDPTSGHVQTAVNKAREDEQKRLSAEIHDGPAQVLVNAIHHVQYVEQIAKRIPEQLPDELKVLQEILKEGVAEVRRFMFDLQPTTLQDYGLGPSIQRYVDMFGALRGQKWHSSILGELPNLNPDQTLAVFRIIQESLHNAQKHAGEDATVDVTLETISGTLQVTIKDNGAGFDAAMVAPKMLSGRGLGGMRDRASTVNAELVIKSQLGTGTTVLLTMPFESQSNAGT